VHEWQEHILSIADGGLLSVFIDECGDVPWVEQPETIREALVEFLK